MEKNMNDLVMGRLVSVEDDLETKSLIKTTARLLKEEVNADNVLSEACRYLKGTVKCVGLKYVGGMYALYFFRQYPAFKHSRIVCFTYAHNFHDAEFSEAGDTLLHKIEGKWYV